MRPTSRDHLVLVSLVLTGLLIKVLWLGNNELAHDEPFTVVMAHRSLSDLFAALRSENNPPLYFFLMHIWVDTVPLEEGWLRLPSAVFSALAVWPLFLLGRALGGFRTALTASLIFTFSNYHYGFAHEVRAYALFTLLAIWSMWLLYRCASDQGRSTRMWVGLAVVNTLMVYTHFFGWLMIGVELLCVILVKQMKSQRMAFLRSMAVIAACFLPMAWVFFIRLGASVQQGTWLKAPVPEELYNMIWKWSNAPFVAVLFLLLIAVAFWRSKGRGPGMGIGLLWTFAPLFGMYAVSSTVPVFLDRYLCYAAPGFALLVAMSTKYVPLAERTSTAVMAMAVLGMAFTFTPWMRTPLRPSAVVQQAEAWRGNGVVILQPGFYSDTYAWHLDRDLVTRPEALQQALSARWVYAIHNASDLPEIAFSANSVVRVDAWSDLTDPGRSAHLTLGSMFPVLDSMQADHSVWIFRYSQ